MYPTPYDNCEYVSTIEMDLSTYYNKSFIMHYPDFIFRGQGNCDWTVTPSFYRVDKKVWREYIDSISMVTRCPNHINENSYPIKDYAERLILKRFHDLSNLGGLYLPPDRPKWMTDSIENIVANWENNTYSHDGTKQIASLAQHHGCPTRLLDWTYNIDAACYFATRPSEDLKDYCVIWAIDIRLIRLIMEMERDSNNGLMEIIIPLYYKNDNIIAQAGVFTLLPDGETDMIRYLNNVCRKYSDFVSGFRERNGTNPMYQYIISKKNAEIIYRQLIESGKDANSFFPGYEGVTRSIEESLEYYRATRT